MPRRVFARLWLLTIASLVVFAACNSEASTTQAPPPASHAGTPDVRPRTFQMGVSSLPPRPTDESYASTFKLIGAASDVVLIQRVPPWSELLSGDFSDATVATTKREVQLAHENNLDIFFAIDPTDPTTARSDLAGLPSDLAGARFADERVRNALLSYARYVVTNYHPKYLAFGVEINSYQIAQPLDFERFVVLYKDAYRAVKELSPDTLMFPTFQLEDLQGLLPLDAPRAPQWYLIRRFEPELDMLAVSSYPRSVFESVDNLPLEYFTQLQKYTTKPIALVSTGYPSSSDTNDSTEALQATYLLRMLNYAQEMKMSLVVWFLSQDSAAFGSDPAHGRLTYLGLLRQDGTPKQAWDIWATVHRRPLAERAP